VSGKDNRQRQTGGGAEGAGSAAHVLASSVVVNERMQRQRHALDHMQRPQ